MQPHLKINPQDISPYVLLPGDPARVDIIGSYLKNFKIISSNREFRVGTGEYKNKKITICSTGIGCPSTAIATEELIAAGAKYLIRIGTCGGAWRRDIGIGDVIIAIGAVRDEGTTPEYIPLGFPAIANYKIIAALKSAAEKNNASYYLGINRTHDAYYGNQDTIVKWGRYLLEDRWKNNDTPILSSDMENSALLVIATLRGAAAGAILAVNANPEPLRGRILGKSLPVITEQSPDVTAKMIEQTIRIALDALIGLS